MKLYTNNKGQWVGTQADAKKLGKFTNPDVPVDKKGLLDFLNTNKVGTTMAESEPVQIIKKPDNKKLKSGSWDAYNKVRDHLETCSAKELNTALSIITNRLHDFIK